MSATRVITETGQTIDIPRDVESEGKEAIDAFVAAELAPQAVEAAPTEAAD